jgi:DNA repair protein RadC
VMGIDIIDHIIIGKHEFYSIKEGRKVHMWKNILHLD